MIDDSKMAAIVRGIFVLAILIPVDAFSVVRGGVCLGFQETGGSDVKMTMTTTRKAFFVEGLSRVCVASIGCLIAGPANAFEGGVGGLGKTKPETGVVFRDATVPTTQSSTGVVSQELISNSSSKSLVLVSFQSPWPLQPSQTSLECRDLSQPESAFVQVGTLEGSSPNKNITPAFLTSTIFGSKGKFGAYGSPSDIKIKTLEDELFVVKFTTLTPGMRESDRMAYLTVKRVDDSVFILITATTAARFKKLEPTMKKIAGSFEVIPAPKSTLLKSQ